MKLTIIIAVYNGEMTISRALDSILESSLPKINYEIIVVNDGSLDSTVEKISPYLAQYDNIRLINKDNGGQSTARNIGFKLAKGEYIFCLDADDYINSDHLLPALELVEKKKCDLASICFIVKRDNINRVIKYPKIDTYSIGSFVRDNIIIGSMAFYFYKTAIIKDNNLELIEGIFHEDEEFILKYMSYCNSIFVSNIPLYNYIIHNNSTVHKEDINHKLKLLKNLIVVISSLKTRLSQLTDEDMTVGFRKKITQLQLSVFIRFFKDGVYKILSLTELFGILDEYELYPIGYCNKFKYNAVAYLLNKKFIVNFFNMIITL